MTYEEHLQTMRDWDERARKSRRKLYVGYVLTVLNLAWGIYFIFVVIPKCPGGH